MGGNTSHPGDLRWTVSRSRRWSRNLEDLPGVPRQWLEPGRPRQLSYERLHGGQKEASLFLREVLPTAFFSQLGASLAMMVSNSSLNSRCEKSLVQCPLFRALVPDMLGLRCPPMPSSKNTPLVRHALPYGTVPVAASPVQLARRHLSVSDLGVRLINFLTLSVVGSCCSNSASREEDCGPIPYITQ